MFTKYRKSNFSEPYTPTFTVPDQSFTPREILDQFASGEVVVQQNHPTDDFYDDKYSDDDLVDRVVDVNDEFAARQYVIDFNIAQNEAETSNSIRDGSDQGAAVSNDGVSGSAGMEGSQDASSESAATS